MARGDVKKAKRRTRYMTNAEWDAQQRQDSKREFDKVRYSDDPVEFLNGLSDSSLVKLYDETTKIESYGHTDWSRIVRMLPDGKKEGIIERVNQAKQQEQEEEQERIKRARKQANDMQESMKDEARLTTGYIHSEIAQAIRYKESYGLPYGDWLDDPVAAITGQGGFGEEIRYSTGIKLEINMALDCSNSMWYNDLSTVAVNTFRDMYLALKLAASQLPDDSLTVNAWKWAMSDDGKSVYSMSHNYRGEDKEVDKHGQLGGMGSLPSWSADWTGQDTWLYPLLEAIEDWENRHGNHSAFRLDIVISDGVLEHPTDARKCDEIQERRDGNLQSVMLNFLPMEEWGDYRVPNRFVQYEATVENIGALMRSILGDWIVGVM